MNAKNSSEIEDTTRVALNARDVSWDWTGLPMHYVGNNPLATHVCNGVNLLLPEGEVFFVDVFQKALALVKDDQVREDVIGFIGQEATHSAAHQTILDYLQEQGLDMEPFVEQIRWLFRKVLGDRNLTGKRAESWLIERVAIVAAIEHFTSWLGDWGLNATAWDTEFEPRALDLFRWHLAEEVEHRHVAFDLFTHLDGSYWHRIRAWLVVSPIFAMLWARGTMHLLRVDPTLEESQRKFSWRYLRQSYKRGLIFTPGEVGKMWLEYFRPGYHPSKYGSTSQAVAYLAQSPAARKAA